MKILFITPSDKVGGGNRVMFELAARLSRDHQVTVAFPRSPGRPKYHISHRVRAIATGFVSDRPLSMIPNLLSLYLWLARNKKAFDCVVSTGQLTGIFLPFLGHRRLFNLIQTDEYAIFEQGHLRDRPILYRIYSWLIGRSLRATRIGYIFNSAYTHRIFTTVRPGIQVPLIVVRPGVDTAVFRPASQRIAGKRLIVATLARDHALKGLDVLIDAYKALPLDFRSKVEWSLITNDTLQGCRIPQPFTIHRPQSDSELAGLLQRSDIFLSTSLWEGFGLPALEAMACGCAVVTSQNGGCEEYAVHGGNCLTYPPRDHCRLAGHIARLICDRELRAAISRGGLRTAGRFTWEFSAGRLLDIIRESS